VRDNLPHIAELRLTPNKAFKTYNLEPNAAIRLLHGYNWAWHWIGYIMGPKSKGNARGGGPKPGTKQAKAAAEKSAQPSSAQQTDGEAKKPTVKQLIGGASWTGKLPVNLLSEHCQKQKWEKPEYIMV
jgi:hypothetical protein